MKNIKKEIAKGSVWMVGLKWFTKGLGVISTLFLARLLLPEDFGLVATATIFVSLLNYIGELSLDSALIQNQDRAPELYSSAWTFNLLVCAAQCLALASAAVYISEYFSDPRLEEIIYLLALTFLFKGAKNVGVVDFRKNMEFDKEFQLMAGAKIVSFIVTLAIAILYQTYWALIIGIVVNSACESILSYLMHPFRPTLTLRRFPELFSFSKWLYLINIMRFVTNRGPHFFLAKYAGQAQLGFFTIGFELATVPTVELMAPINRAMFPGFSKMQNDMETFKATYLDSSSLLALAILPAGLGVVAIAPVLVPTALGDKWFDVIPVVALIGTLGALRGICANASPVILAMGVPHIQVIQNVMWTSILLPASYIMCDGYGAVGVAFAFLVTDVMMLPYRLYCVLKLLNISVKEWSQVIVRPLLGSLIMLVVIGTLSMAAPFAYSDSLFRNLGSVLGLVVLGVIVFSSSVFLLWTLWGKPRSPETRFLELIRNEVIPRLSK